MILLEFEKRKKNKNNKIKLKITAAVRRRANGEIIMPFK